MGDFETGKIRNICILAHVDHGKTTLADHLIASSGGGVLHPKQAGRLRFMDYLDEEQRRAITMKSSSIALQYKDHSINLIDSPGHMDFCSEVSTAARLSDGGLVLVDAVEGVHIQTHAVLRQAWIEKLTPCLVLNKIDRLICELKFNPMEAYNRLQRIVHEVNGIMSAYKSEKYLSDVDSILAGPSDGLDDENLEFIEDDEEDTFQPQKGNVAFVCALDGWGFCISDFAEFYASKLGASSTALQKALWGPRYYIPKTKMIVGKKGVAGNSKAQPMFVKFVLEPLWQVYQASLEVDGDKEILKKVIEKFNLSVPPRELQNKDPKLVLQAVMCHWLPLSDAILSMVVKYMPDPMVAQSFRISRLLPKREIVDDRLSSDVLAAAELVRKSVESCDSRPEAPCVAFVSKMFAVPLKMLPQRGLHGEIINKSTEDSGHGDSDECFLAFARIFSGVLCSGQKVYVLSALYDPLKGEMMHKHVQEAELHSLYLMMGQGLKPVASAKAGNVVAIRGLGQHILKSATLSSTKSCWPFSSMVFQVAPTMKVAIEPSDPADIGALMKGLRLLNEEATDFKDKGSESDSLDNSLSSVRGQYLKVEKEMVNNSSKSDVSICGEPECSSGQIQNDGSDEAKVMRSNALTSKMEVQLTVIDGISDCSEDLQNMKCEPACGNAGEGGTVPSDAENSNEQALVSEIGEVEVMDMEEALTSEFDAYSNDLSFPWEDQHMKAVGSSGNDVAQGQEDMGTPLEGIVVSRTQTIMGTATLEETKYVKQNSDVNVMCDDISLIAEEETKGTHVFEGVTSNEVDLVFEVEDESCTMDGKCIVFDDIHEEKDSKKSDNESIMGRLVESIGTFPVDKSQGEHLEENVSLPDEFNCIDVDVQGIEGDVDLQFSECLDESATGNCAGVSSDLDYRLGVEVQYNDEAQVDLHREQDAEVQDQSLGIEKSTVLDEKIPKQMSPEPGSGVTECHSCYLLPPKNEGEFSVSDLVWGRVRSHPWWPGQIFDPADASEKAVKYHKKDCFLVAYFGDRTFAWNDASLLRPFRAHFSQIENQSNSEAFQHAVNSALAEVSRRVKLGLACSCIPKVALVEIESQIVENTGIHQEASRRYGVDESTGVSCFEPEKLVDNIRSLALVPSAGDDRLELVIAKAQLSCFSSFKGHRPLPEFHICGGLLENHANTSEMSEMIEKQIKGVNNSSNKRKHDLSDCLHSSKKERSMTGLMGDLPHSSDGEDELDGNVVDKSVTSAGRKRKALDYVTDGSDERISFYTAKVSTTAAPIPKPSFKVGECIRRVASQLTGSPSLLKCNSEKFLKFDDGVDQQVGFDVAVQTPVYSQRGRILSPEHSSLDELLSQLHLAARDPMKGYSFLNTITSFFSDFRHLIALSENSRRRNPSTGRGGRKKKAPSVIANSPEDFEFDDVNDSYWTDRMVHNYAEEQLLHNAQNGEGEYQLVNYEPDMPLKSGRRSRKRVYSGDHELQAEEPAEHAGGRRQDCSPTELILNFTEGNSVPSELNLNKIFRRFGPLRESETEVDRQTSRARVVFKKCSDAEVAFSSSGKFNIFGPMLVNYELSYVPSAPFKTLALATLQAQEDAT